MCGADGSEPLDELANTIWHSVGPSGRNKVSRCLLRNASPFGVLVTTHAPQDYLYELAKAVHKLSPDSFDSHLFALEVGLPSSPSELCTTANY